MEEDLTRIAPRSATAPLDELARRCEQARDPRAQGERRKETRVNHDRPSPARPGGAGATTAAPARAVVIGYGCRLRADDAIGPLAADALARGRLPDAEIHAVDRDGTVLLDLWEGRELAIVIDAVRTAGTATPPGTLHRWDGLALPPPESAVFPSSHAVGLREAVALGAALGRLPRRLVILAVEARAFEPGAAPSPEVESVLGRMRAIVLREIAAAQ
jgi:hydrogenase maturation protease